MEDAACARSPEDLWQLDRPDPETVELARKVCSLCPVRAECERYALANPSLTGMWAGLTELERFERRLEALPAAEAAYRRVRAARAVLGVFLERLRGVQSIEAWARQVSVAPTMWARYEWGDGGWPERRVIEECVRLAVAEHHVELALEQVTALRALVRPYEALANEFEQRRRAWRRADDEAKRVARAEESAARRAERMRVAAERRAAEAEAAEARRVEREAEKAERQASLERSRAEREEANRRKDASKLEDRRAVVGEASPRGAERRERGQRRPVTGTPGQRARKARPTSEEKAAAKRRMLERRRLAYDQLEAGRAERYAENAEAEEATYRAGVESAAAAVRQMRRACGLSQRDLARRSGVAPADISRLERATPVRRCVVLLLLQHIAGVVDPESTLQELWPMPPVMTRDEAAERLGCSEHTLRRLVLRGELRTFRDGRFSHVFAEDVERLAGPSSYPRANVSA